MTEHTAAKSGQPLQSRQPAAGRDVLKVAAGELGNTEHPANSNRTKYGAWYGLDGNPWCMMFVQWCFAQAGCPLPYRTASCAALLSWYRKHQPERVVSLPEPRDIIIYNFGHTGIVESVAAGTGPVGPSLPLRAILLPESPGANPTAAESSGGPGRRRW